MAMRDVRARKSGDRDAVDRFLGVGWASPVAVRADGTIALSEHDENVSQAIRIILGTNRGERVMRPNFGAGLRDFVLRPISAGLLAQVKQRVSDALVDEEPRIDVLSIDVTRDGTSAARLLIDVAYQVRSTNTRTNLVYPFYLQEGTST